MTLAQLLEQIEPKNEAAEQETRRRWNACAKPLGSLGLLEDALCQIASVTGSVDIDLNKKALLIFCADNGVVAQGVTQTGSEVTAMVARGFAEGTTPACRMARRANCKLIPVDMGIKDFSPQPGVLNRRVANGTGDISKGPAMTREQAEQAILAGALLVKDCKEQDVSLLATGEMGIGNTTTASAVASVLLGCEPEAITGRGAGLSDEGLARKKAAICRAIQINQPNPADPLDMLAKLGGFDIAGMCGAFLGGAAFGVPVLMDGVISAAAALLAVRLCSDAGKAILASHVSAEPAGALLLNALDKHPLITAGLRLGEGTGALAAMPLLDMAQAVYEESNTFENYGMEAYQPQAGAMRGMGLLPCETEFTPSKARTCTAAKVLTGPFAGAAMEGYEIHMGRTKRPAARRRSACLRTARPRARRQAMCSAPICMASSTRARSPRRWQAGCWPERALHRKPSGLRAIGNTSRASMTCWQMRYAPAWIWMRSIRLWGLQIPIKRNNAKHTEARGTAKTGKPRALCVL